MKALNKGSVRDLWYDIRKDRHGGEMSNEQLKKNWACKLWYRIKRGGWSGV